MNRFKIGVSIGLTCLMLIGCQQGIRDYIGAVGLTRVHADENVVCRANSPSTSSFIEKLGKSIRRALYASAREAYEQRRAGESSASNRGSDVGTDEPVVEGYVLPETDGSDAGQYSEVSADDSQPEVISPYSEPEEDYSEESVNCGEWVYYGNCRITFYDDGPCCCGEFANGYTASGEPAIPGWTVANGSLEFGTMVMIDGQQYCVTDRGVDGDQFDVLVSTHDEALARGMYYTDVYILE